MTVTGALHRGPTAGPWRKPEYEVPSVGPGAARSDHLVGCQSGGLFLVRPRRLRFVRPVGARQYRLGSDGAAGPGDRDRLGAGGPDGADPAVRPGRPQPEQRL